MKTTTQWMGYLLLMISVLSFSSCSDNDFLEKTDNDGNGGTTPTAKTKLTVTCQLPEHLKAIEWSNITLILTDLSTQKAEKIIPKMQDMSFTVEAIEGLYSMSVEGEITYQLADKEQVGKVRGEFSSIKVVNKTVGKTLPLQLYDVNQSFVFAEIFFTGTQTPEGKSYYADKYFRIYNNSNVALDAQGLAIAESEFMSVSQRNYTPDIKSEAMAIGVLYMIPRGKAVIVQPGESLLLCDVAKNHKEANLQSFDESDADFEWFDETSRNMDTDTEVPNLVKVYSYSKTIWTLHNRGFKSYALVKLPQETTPEQYLKDYKYDYHYDLVIGGQTYPMDRSCYKVPNEWIVDAVNLSVEAKYEWNPLSSVLDKGWTYCGKIDKDPTRFGKSVRRKVLAGKILQDTNDSSIDFLSEQKADPHFKFHE
jgi:hypothetical protein